MLEHRLDLLVGKVERQVGMLADAGQHFGQVFVLPGMVLRQVGEGADCQGQRANGLIQALRVELQRVDVVAPLLQRLPTAGFAGLFEH
ncbi:hypothetical protein D3C77_634710 [compost metagenome]